MDPSTILLFGGRMTLMQLLACIGALAVVGLAVKLIKGAVKTIVIACAIAAALVYNGIASPSQIADASERLGAAGIEACRQLADASDRISVQDGRVSVFIGGEWLNIAEITAVTKGSGRVAVQAGSGRQYVTDDPAVIKLLDLLRH